MDLSQISTQLSDLPQAFPNCCLSISSTLIAHVAELLPKHPGFTASIGSGSGLLEALIAHGHPSLRVEGVEVNTTVNRYISEQDINVVSGTWDLYPGAGDASAWMFVYPREPKLVTQYLDTYGDQAVDLILWLGPRADWDDYEPCFRAWESSFPDDIGLAPFEMLAVIRQRRD